MKISIIFEGLDEGEVGGFAGAEGVSFGGGALVGAVADAGAVCECFGLGVEGFGVAEVDCIVGIEVFFEALDVAVLGEVDKNGVCEDVNFD